MNYATPTTYKKSPEHQKRKTETKSEKPTMTVPGEALSIQQMFERFSRGIPVTATKREPIFSENATHEDVDLEQLKNADLVDKQEFSEALGEKMKQMKSDIDENKKKASEAKKMKEDQEFAEKLKKHQQTNVPPKKDEPGVTPH